MGHGGLREVKSSGGPKDHYYDDIAADLNRITNVLLVWPCSIMTVTRAVAGPGK